MLPLLLFLISPFVAAQNQTHNLTPEGYWHNRYHSLLSMAAYGDSNDTCPYTTFTPAAKAISFPNSSYPSWDPLGTFGPTPSGCQGYFAIVPEMNKALIVFQGNYSIEQNLPIESTSWDAFGMDAACPACKVNAFAAKGYMECKAETNNWEVIRNAYAGNGLVFSITGHGLGGMHSLIASVDLNHQNIAYYSHTQGAPRTFDRYGANYYNYFNGEAGERAVAQNDQFTEVIPAGPNYAHAGTPFYYWGYNASTLAMNWRVCWDGAANNAPIVDDPLCMPQAYGDSSPIEDHYFYFTNVGQCGSQTDSSLYLQDTSVADGYVYNIQQQMAIASASVASVVSVSSVSIASVESAFLSSVSSSEAFWATASPVAKVQDHTSASFRQQVVSLAIALIVTTTLSLAIMY